MSKLDALDSWMMWLRDVLSGRGQPVRLFYDDKLAGDVLVLAVDSEQRDRLVEVVVARRPKGHAQIAVLATTRGGAAAVQATLARLHTEISRLANARRKFIHRVARVLDRLVASWPEREAGYPSEGLVRLQAALPEAAPMTGAGYHVDRAGDAEHHSRASYPPVYAAAVPTSGRWRGLPWDAGAGRFVVRAATLATLKVARPGLDLDAAGLSIAEAAVVGAAAAVAAATAADAAAEIVADPRRKESSWLPDGCDAVTCSLDAIELGACIPDCSVADLGDCGGLDCSL